MRTALVVAALVTSLAAPPAHAADVLTLVCSIRYEATTAQPIPGSGTCSVSGTRAGTMTVTINVWVVLGAPCHVSDNAWGTFEGVGLRVDFNWTRFAHTFFGNWTYPLGSGQGVSFADDPTRTVCDVRNGTPATETAVITLVLV